MQSSRLYPQGGRGIKAKYNSSGVFEVKDNSGNVIYSLDPSNRKMSFPSGSTLSMSGTQEFDEIVGNDSSLGITGAAPASVTAAGGAVATAGGIGGATSGAGGLVSMTGGVGTNGNSAGGATSCVGGAGQGSAAGGAVSVTGGIGGTTGDGGAVTIAGGSSGGGSDTGGLLTLNGGAANSGTAGDVAVATVGNLGFFGVSPVAQASHIADVTGNGDVDSEVNAISLVLSNLGLTANS